MTESKLNKQMAETLLGEIELIVLGFCEKHEIDPREIRLSCGVSFAHIGKDEQAEKWLAHNNGAKPLTRTEAAVYALKHRCLYDGDGIRVEIENITAESLLRNDWFPAEISWTSP